MEALLKAFVGDEFEGDNRTTAPEASQDRAGNVK